MKFSIKNSILFVTLVVLISSCKKDYLQTVPVSNLSDIIFFKTEADIDQALSGVYNRLLRFPDNHNEYLSEFRSSNYFVPVQGAARDYYSISAFDLTSSLAALQTAWANDYDLIQRANKLLGSIDAIPYTDTTKRNRIKGEARFLRGLSYFELVKNFGAVPLVDRVISSSEALNYPRVGIDTVYNFIVNDFMFASTVLPSAYSGTDVGRATKWAALGMLGRAYMFMAGYPLNKTENFEKAKSVFKQVLNAENTGWKFAPTYAEMFKAANDNKYYLFEVQYVSGGQGLGSRIPGEVIPIDLDRKIVPWGYYFVTEGEPSQDFINSFEPGDKRKFVTIDTIYRNTSNALVRRNYVKKFLDSASGSTTLNSQDWPINYPLLRSEDVMLMYAEAVNETGGPTTEAVGLVNRIRTRAGLPNINPASKSEFKLALENERRHEFGWEGLYWYDLIRTGRALAVMNPWLQANYGKTIDETQLVYPVPRSEMLVRPGLYLQNPGYN